MRKAIIFGALAALLGLATVAQASDDDAAPGARQVAQERVSDHDRYERREHVRDHDDDDGDDDGHDRYERHDRSHNDRD